MTKNEKLLKAFLESRRGAFGVSLSDVADILEKGFSLEELKILAKHLEKRSSYKVK
jgi:hypothetical protein